MTTTLWADSGRLWQDKWGREVAPVSKRLVRHDICTNNKNLHAYVVALRNTLSRCILACPTAYCSGVDASHRFGGRQDWCGTAYKI